MPINLSSYTNKTFTNNFLSQSCLKTTPLFCLAFLSGCGGGSGGSSIVAPIDDTNGTDDTDDTIIITPNVVGDENRNWGLDAINASALNNAGGTGAGQLVALIDTGIQLTHSEFEGKIHTASYTYDGNTEITAENNHGTHVAGIIAAQLNGQGGKGVAYDASLLSIGIIGDPTLTMADIAAGFTHANNNGAKILNNSWVIDGVALNDISTTEATAIYGSNIRQAASQLVADDSAFVWAAGNDGQSEVNIMAGLPYHFPELKDGWVAVVSIDQSGELSSFSNECGQAAEWCIAAPGSDIYSTSHDGEYATYSGTSIAAPHISGGLAALKSAFPNLSNQQILARMLHTANKTGIYANSEIYGNGLVDLSAASAPVGDLKIATGATDANAALASSSVVVLPKTLLAGLDIDTASTNVLLVDSFQSAPFWAKASQYIQETKAPVLSIRWSSLFSTAGKAPTQALSLGENMSLSFNQNKTTQSVDGFTLRLKKDSGIFAFGNGNGDAVVNNVLGLSHSGDWLAHSNDGYIASAYQHEFTENRNVQFNFGVASKNDLATDITKSHLLEHTTGDLKNAVISGLTMNLDNTSKLSLQLETGSIDNLNNQSSAEGAFAIDSARLANVSIGVSKEIGDGKLTASLGYADITSDSGSSLIDLPDNIGLTTAKVGYTMLDNARHGLRVGATFRKASGEDIQVRLPNSIDSSGNIDYATFSSDVGNLYDEKALELGYNYLLNRNITLGLEAVWQQISDSDSRYAAVVGFELHD